MKSTSVDFIESERKIVITRTNVSKTNKPDTRYVNLTIGKRAVINMLLKKGWKLVVKFVQYLTKQDKEKNRPHLSISKIVKSLKQLGLRAKTAVSEFFRNKLVGEEVEVKNISKPVLKYGSFCSGMGSSATALKDMGIDFDFVYSSEIEKHPKDTVKHNFPDIQNQYGDLFKLSGENLPYVDMISAGFPCTTFSLCGLMKGFNDRRGTVIFHLSEIFQDLIKFGKAPKIIKLENVSHLTRHDAIKGEYDSIFADKDHKKKIGHTLHVIEEEVLLPLSKYYDITWSIDNTIEYGIAHNRQRWFCVLTLKKSPYTFDFSKVREKRVPLTTSVKDYLIPENKVNPSCYVKHNFIPKTHKNSGHLERVGSLEGVSYEQSKRVLGINKGAGCFTCNENAKYLIRGRVRNLDIPEKLALQAFPKWYQFPTSVPNGARHKMLGNTMSINISKVIFEVMFDKNNFKTQSLFTPVTSSNNTSFDNNKNIKKAA